VDLAHESGVLKNGIMFGDNFNAPYDIGDSTLAAEAHGLVVRKLASKQPLLQVRQRKTKQTRRISNTDMYCLPAAAAGKLLTAYPWSACLCDVSSKSRSCQAAAAAALSRVLHSG